MTEVSTCGRPGAPDTLRTSSRLAKASRLRDREDRLSHPSPLPLTYSDFFMRWRKKSLTQIKTLWATRSSTIRYFPTDPRADGYAPLGPNG